MVVIEAVGRLVPGVMGNDSSATEESFSDGLLEHPQYTRPAEFRGWEVPEVLRSGDHGRITRWRRAQALLRTIEARPDLIEASRWPVGGGSGAAGGVRAVRCDDRRRGWPTAPAADYDFSLVSAGHRACAPHHRFPAGARAMKPTDLVDQPEPPRRRSRVRSRRHPEGARAGRRGHPRAGPDLPGCGDPSPGRRHRGDVHGPQGVLRRRRRAHLPGPLAGHLQDRGVTRGDVRRAKLYYLRDRVGKSAKIKEMRD